jgi:hypothetical protein
MINANTRADQQASELVLQIMHLDGRILVVATGSSGEAFHFIEEVEVAKLVEESSALHQRIEALIEQDQAKHSQPTAYPSNTQPGSPSGFGPIHPQGPSDQAGPTAAVKAEAPALADELRSLGEDVFRSVFKDHVLDLLNVAIGQAVHLEGSVTIRLMIADDFLNLIPWELLCSKGTYLCHAYDLVRHPFALQPNRSPLPADGPHRVLFVGANPRNDLPIKDQIEAVKQVIPEATMLITGNASHTKIADHLFEGVDILHFIGHGEYLADGQRTRGYFLIDGEGEKKEDRMTAEMLQSFCRANPVRLAILNACRSDQGLWYGENGSLQQLQKSGYFSMAHALIQAGVANVIGMAHPISKRGGGILTRRLYRVLVEQHRPLTTAMRQVRLELFAHSDNLLPSDWLTPVLYSRAPIPSVSQTTIRKE